MHETARTLSLDIENRKARVLLQEAGGHRVQRVPPTERRGRVHSSTVTVSVLEDKKSDHPAMLRDPEHFDREWFSGSGAGGQHRNRHKNALRLRHLPTQTLVSAQCRKRPESEAQAWAEMESRLDEMVGQAHHGEQAAVRKAQVGSGQKADKRRTYRFQDDRVIDHETGKSAKACHVMKGEFDRLW